MYNFIRDVANKMKPSWKVKDSFYRISWKVSDVQIVRYPSVLSQSLCLCVSVSLSLSLCVVCCVLCVVVMVVVVVVVVQGGEEKGRDSSNHLVPDFRQSFPRDC